MKFTVCIKQVPDVAVASRLEDGRVVQDTGRMILNAYDASALEECLVLREKHGGEVDVVLVGPARAAETIRKALAMGADRATHVVAEDANRFDSRTIALILAAHFGRNPADVIACGKQAQDTDAGLTGGMLAGMLKLPYTTNAVGLDLETDALVVERQGDSGREVIALPFPCLVTCSNDMNDPRIPSLKGIMQSKKKPLEEVNLTELGVEDALAESRRISPKVVGYRNPPARPPGKMLEGEPQDIVAQLMSEL